MTVVAAQWILLSLLVFRACIFVFLALIIKLGRQRRLISTCFTLAAIVLSYFAGAFSTILR